ncbi:hypothetical protein UCDDA912_g09402 [Diaporthe ampelina]|uniref:Uncharacterized protein n=1 Tax=Diaporthe ampelina TaxID=1214573 RepID=A0A0G2H618_9PEZI|nr:hypothetical protein UCDDA912_g09402 [Diaporthe ampelina]
MEDSQRQDDLAVSGGDVMLDHEVIDLMNQLDLVRRASDMPLTEAEQARVMGQIIDQKLARKRAAQSQFDEEAMAEAARAMKRRRIAFNADFSGAHKMYACGPEEQPNGSNGSGHNDFDDLMFDEELLGLSPGFSGAHSTEPYDLRCVQDVSQGDVVPTYKPGFNLLESVCSSIWLAVEVAKHLRVSDIVNFYSTSKTFHNLLNKHWQSSIFAWAEYMAPSSFRIFYWKFFGCYTRTDPSETTWEAPGLFADAFPRPPWASQRTITAADKTVRSVPGLKYLAMLVKREGRVRDILAMMARNGHRLPSKCHEAVKKMWMLMDLPTNTLRRAFIRSTQLWTPEDIYIAQMFVTKLQMRFNEPVFGPDAPMALETILGSPQGFTPLWQMLRGRKYTDLLEAMQMRARYMPNTNQVQRRSRIWDQHYGVPHWQLGVGHLEGWGHGRIHLSRPDELVIEEAARRGINLKDHLIYMTFWGHVDWQKRENLVPTEEEMYMSDDELPPLTTHEMGPDGLFGNCGNVPFEYGEWTPKHALLARWDTLTKKEKLALREHIGRDETKMLAHEDDDEGFWDLNEHELSRLSLGEEKNTAITAPDKYDSEDDAKRHVAVKREEHDRNCVCDQCIIESCCRASGCNIDAHDGSCVCTECLDEADYEAELEDEYYSEDSEDEDEDEDEDDGSTAVQEVLEISPTDPMPQEVLLNPAIRDAWNSLRPEDKNTVTTSLDMQREQERAAASVQARGIPRQFPSITDPVSLALLHKLDGIENQPAGGESDITADGDEEMVDEGYEGDEMEAEGHHGDIDTSSNSSMDDEQLKALADLDYSDNELHFDMDNFQAHMARGRDDGSYHYRAGGGDGDGDEAFGAAHEADLRSPGLAAEMRLPDTINY